MKKLTSTLTKTFGLLLLLMAVVSSCKKSSKEDPAPAATSNLSGKIDGKDIAITQSALTSTYYTNTGEPSALMTSAALDASGTKMDFFIPDVTAGTYNITPKLGTSSNPGNPNLKVQATTSTTTQTYISYTSSGSVYFAISGTITVTIDDTKITVKWDISFKDAAARVFTSTGSFTIYFYKAVTKPKTEVRDPTPVSAKPTIDNIASTAGAAGDEVSIAGTNFSTVLTEDVVKFNGVAATVKSATATLIKVTVPAGTTGAVTVKVNNSETATGPIFTYVLPPTISAITPLTGKVGDPVTITGANFSTISAENAVTFNGTAATVTTVSATSLTVSVPAGATTGAVALKVRGKDATLNAGVLNTFTVTIPANVIAITPIQGSAGTQVTVTGTGFSTILSDNVVTFNGTTGIPVSANATTLVVTAPTGVTTGEITVKVRGVQATIAAGVTATFTVVAASGFGTPGQAYGITTSYYSPTSKTYDNDGNLWVIDNSGQINRQSYLGGDALKTIAPSFFNGLATVNLSSYTCTGLARDANGGIHAYIYGSGVGGAGNPTFVATVSTPNPSKDFDTQFIEKGTDQFAMDALSNVFMITTRYGSSDVIRLKSDGTSEIYLKGGTGGDNTLGAANAYGLSTDGTNLYVLTYTTGSPNTGAAIYKFDSSKNRTLVATLPDGGYADGALASSKFNDVRAIAVNGSNIYISDYGNNRIRKLDTRSNTVSTFAGNGSAGTTYSGAALDINIIPGGLLIDANHGVLYNFGAFTHTITRMPY